MTRLNPNSGLSPLPASAAEPAVVVMAKRPVPGRVKTRLMTELSAEQAAAVHAAMMQCVLERVAAHVPGRLVLALDSLPSALTNIPAVQTPARWQIIEQGEGDLGQRLDRVWRAAGARRVIFLGVDSPDVPASVLRSLAPATAETGVDAAIGPAMDGGYWTLTAQRYLPTLVQGIDWGTATVYHQTTEAAARAGLSLRVLPAWHDVDEPNDLAALMRRLESASPPEWPPESPSEPPPELPSAPPREPPSGSLRAPEPALARLRDRLRQTLAETHR